MSEPDTTGCHLAGTDLWRAGPFGRNTVAIRSRVTGEYIRPSFVNLTQPPQYNKGVKTTPDRAKAIHYRTEDVAGILAWLGAGWEAVTPAPPPPAAAPSGQSTHDRPS